MSTGTEVARTNVMDLIELAKEGSIDVGILERMIALQERAVEKEARQEFFRALKAFQEDCPELHKSKSADIVTKSGGRYGYNYAPLDGIAKTVRPVLHRHGLSYSWTTDPSTDKGVLNVVCVLRHVDGHETRATFPVPTDTNAAMSAAQKNGAALTYGQRMSLVSVLGLTATDDIDGAEDEAFVDSGQVDILKVLIRDSQSDTEKFLLFMGVEKLGDIMSRDYARAVSSLRRKAGAK